MGIELYREWKIGVAVGVLAIATLVPLQHVGKTEIIDNLLNLNEKFFVL